MKLLFDTGMPKKLASHFPPEFEVHTAQKMGWAGEENGDLLRFAADKGFAALITTDRNMEYQQNVNKLPMAVVVLQAFRGRIENLIPLMPRILEVLNGELQNRIYHVKEATAVGGRK